MPRDCYPLSPGTIDSLGPGARVGTAFALYERGPDVKSLA